jgi:hypothetical protein
MISKPLETGIRGDTAESVVSAARTSLGGSLRSVVYFTPSARDVLYVRQDRYVSDDAAREAKAELVDLERVGFAERPVRARLARRASGSGSDSGIGAYGFTIRAHENGFVVRALEDDAGVLLTADTMDISTFGEAITAVRGVCRSE